MPDGSELALAAAILGVGKPIAETGCKLIESLLGEPCKVAGGMLADFLYCRQWENRIRFAYRAKQMMDADGIAPKVLPQGFLIPLLEAVGNVDDPDLQEMWVRLLASAIERDANHPAFVHKLRELCRDEAIILNAPTPRRFIMNEGHTPDRPDPRHLPPEERPRGAAWVNVPHMMQILRERLSACDVELVEKIHRPSILFYATHLESLGIVTTKKSHPFDGHRGGVAEHILELHDTEFGQHFVEACCSQRTASNAVTVAAAGSASV